ncbi:DUF2007 domain-containing protein [Phocaeicola abscessus]|uniref:putative signal transducing protein n=1 Tax=Phocaeicola abscessus TaxID=555313 RepID=UPI0003867EC9|nr:DUF2007 domain-containing protein [Phocaeicola abscessus]EPT34094.1 PF09413 family protein [Bacteroidetes bacterium oral taxon 272 str. F0290]
MKTVTLTYCKNGIEAHRIQAVLEEQGILSILQNENMTQLMPIPGFEIPILVDEKDLEQAKTILRDLFPEKMIGDESINYF